LENEKEIILVNPNKITVKDQGTQTNLTMEKISELEKENNTKNGELDRWTKKFVNETPEQVKNKINDLEKQIGLNQQDKDLLKQCTNYLSMLSSYWNNFSQ